MENIVNIHVNIVNKKTNEPPTEDGFIVKFFDKDIIEDDYLGECTLDGRGHGIISITRDDFRSIDSPAEKYPDIYFKVFYANDEIYKSKVYKNLHIEESDPFPASEGIHFDLGTFLI